jgi:hypothetical protein
MSVKNRRFRTLKVPLNLSARRENNNRENSRSALEGKIRARLLGSDARGSVPSSDRVSDK